MAKSDKGGNKPRGSNSTAGWIVGLAIIAGSVWLGAAVVDHLSPEAGADLYRAARKNLQTTFIETGAEFK